MKRSNSSSKDIIQPILTNNNNVKGIIGSSSSRNIFPKEKLPINNQDNYLKDKNQSNYQQFHYNNQIQPTNSKKKLGTISPNFTQKNYISVVPNNSRRTNNLRAIKAIRTPLLDFYSHQKAMIIKNQRETLIKKYQERRRVQHTAHISNKTFYNTPKIHEKQQFSPNGTLIQKGFQTARSISNNHSINNNVNFNAPTEFVNRNKQVANSNKKIFNHSLQPKRVVQINNPQKIKSFNNVQLSPLTRENLNSNSSKKIMNATSVDWKKITTLKDSSQNKNNLNRTNYKNKDFQIRPRPNFNQTARDGFGNFGSRQMASTMSNGFRNQQISQDHNNYLNKFQLMKQIGKGMYGTVYLARKKQNLQNSLTSFSNYKVQEQNQQQQQTAEIKARKQKQRIKEFLLNQDEQKYAIKVYQKFKMNNDPSKFKNIRKEINIMSNLNHPGVIKLYQNIQTLTKINLVVEYAGKLSLLDYLKKNYPLSLKQCQQIGRQLLDALIYLHGKNIVHRDIKLQNILIHQQILKKSSNLKKNIRNSIKEQSITRYQQQETKIFQKSTQKKQFQSFNLQTAQQSMLKPQISTQQRKIQLKLIDYGFSTITNRNRKCNAICGTPNYMAPQLITKKQYIGQEVDIWAYGVVMYTIAEGRHPFKAETMSQLERIINKAKFQFRKIQDKDYQNFIKRILKHKGSERPKAVDLLNSKFLEKEFNQQK